jgi:pyrroline-5-carboxylate reductase
MKPVKISFLGCGNMGRSLIGGLLGNGYPADMLCGADAEPAQRQELASLFNISVVADNNEALKDAEVVVLAVKPQVIEPLLSSVAETLQMQNPLIISIAAGVRLASISRIVGENMAVIRAMPNTPALVQAGSAALIANKKASKQQCDIAESIMRAVGLAVWLDDETKIDAVTALSGSGPAYFFMIMEVMERAASNLGLDDEQARLLTLETALGAAKMAIQSPNSPAILRQQVTSPGGTTERALKVLLDGDIENLFNDALQAANNRSIELADEFENK